MQPDEFIPILEQSRPDPRSRALGTAPRLRTDGRLRHAHGDTLNLSVNVSGAQLDSDAIVEHIRDALAQQRPRAASLIIEVTETALMRNADATARRLQAIKDLGVRIAVDDFGTGYSSLAYLQQFPVDCLKIDRMFTNAITSSPESKALDRDTRPTRQGPRPHDPRRGRRNHRSNWTASEASTSTKSKASSSPGPSTPTPSKPRILVPGAPRDAEASIAVGTERGPRRHGSCRIRNPCARRRNLRRYRTSNIRPAQTLG